MGTSGKTHEGAGTDPPRAQESGGAGSRWIDSLQLSEERRHQSELRFRAFADALTDGVLFFDDSGILDANSVFTEMIGYGLEELIGRSPVDFVVPADQEPIALQMAEESAEIAEVTAVRKDGSTLPVLIGGRKLRFGNSTARVVRIRDLSERHEVLGALEETLSRYRELFETSQDAIYVAGRDGVLRDVNPAAVKLFGFESKEELLAADLGITLYVDPRQRDEFLQRLFEEGSIREYPLTLRTRQGQEIRVLETANVVQDRDGHVIGYHGIMRDVTERRKLERQLVQAQRLEAVGLLAGGIAHDFNNVLTVIIGYSDLALGQVEPGSAVTADLEEIQRAARRATKLTEQLLAFSRRQVLQPRIIDLRTVLHEFDSFLRPTLGADLRIEVELDPDLGLVKADRGQMEQVLMNLAVNAREAMPGGGRIEIKARNERVGELDEIQGVRMVPGQYSVVTVSDTGEGMEEVTRLRAFEPFFTTKGQGRGKAKARGTGLGLATAYGIVKQSGGYIFLESEPGEGATFTIYLPHARGEADQVESAPLSAPSSRGTETVLLVEDDDGIRELIYRGLDSAGYTVLSADGPEQAREHCSRLGEAIDVLLTDLVMPGGDGVALALEVRSQYPNLRILLMSGNPDRSLANSGLEAGEIPLLNKPFTAAELRRRLRAILDDS